jgi:hypothetical protein
VSYISDNGSLSSDGKIPIASRTQQRFSIVVDVSTSFVAVTTIPALFVVDDRNGCLSRGAIQFPGVRQIFRLVARL